MCDQGARFGFLCEKRACGAKAALDLAAVQNANGLGTPEAVATANNSFPAKVTLLLSKESGCKSSYFKEGRTLPYEPSTAPERHPPSKRNGPGGTRTLTCTLARNCAAVTPQAHESELTLVRSKLRVPGLDLFKQSFVLEQASDGRPFFVFRTGGFPQRTV